MSMKPRRRVTSCKSTVLASVGRDDGFTAEINPFATRMEIGETMWPSFTSKHSSSPYNDCFRASSGCEDYGCQNYTKRFGHSAHVSIRAERFRQVLFRWHCQVEADLYDFQAHSTNSRTVNQQVSSCPGR